MIHALGQERCGSSLQEAERHARLAEQLDPSLAEALPCWPRRAKAPKLPRGSQALRRALALESDDTGVNFYDARLLINTGYTREGIARLDRTLANAHRYGPAQRGRQPAAGHEQLHRDRRADLQDASRIAAEERW